MDKSKYKKQLKPMSENRPSVSRRATTKKSGNTDSRVTLKETLTYDSAKKRNRDNVNYIHSEFRDVETRTIENVLIYAQQLPIYGSQHVDEVIFSAQMFKHFDIADKFMVSRMFTISAHFKKNMTVLEYCILICTFITDETYHKTNYAFKIYNFNGDGHLTRKDLRYMLGPTVKQVHMHGDDELEDEEGNINYFIGLILKMIDRDGSASIDHEEFAHIVKRNSLMLECLGNCLPSQKHLIEFKDKICNKDNFEIRALFRNERRNSLRDPFSNEFKHGIQKHYPVLLEFNKFQH